MSTKARPLFDPEIVIPAIGESFKKLNPVPHVEEPSDVRHRSRRRRDHPRPGF